MLFAPISHVVADAAPLRHLVYSFTYESKQNGTVPNDPGSTGKRTYSGKLGDRGTITVDVLREAPDRGLVVVVSEQGEDTRSGSSATCAVYGNTQVVCDPSKPTTSEELTLLRFLGANFIDPSAVDSNNHWSVSPVSPGLTTKADYTISSNDGGMMAIAETRHVENGSLGSDITDIQTKLSYNAAMLVPASVEEYATERRNSGIQGISTTVFQTTLSLVTDSMAGRHP
jgi:hypothetical protein